MGKTTNILDLNNRLAKVEKGNVAQNNYTSLKNKPKINNVTLIGNKSLADIGAASAADLTTLAGVVNDLNNVTSELITELSVPGITLTWIDNNPESHKAIRVGNLVIVNVGLDINGVFTGAKDWIPVYDLPSSLLKSGESFITPYFTSMMCTNLRDNTIYIPLIEGRRVEFDPTVDEYHLLICGQMILPIVKS